VSARIGAALAEYIRRLPGASKYVLLEGISEDTAASLAFAWDGDRLPTLAIHSLTPWRFPEHALSGVSGTGLRNTHPDGVCLVVCEGSRVPDRQSLNSFENVAPADLMENVETLAILARAHHEIPMDGAARDARQAIAQLAVAERPGAAAAAAYFDRLAAGEAPLRALPALGAFRDDAQGDRASSTRIRENLALAARRRSDELMRPAAFGEVRRRAERVLRRRPATDGPSAAAAADRVMRLLQEGSDELLSVISFDEAREILARQQQDLSALARQELDDYKLARRDADPQAIDIPWDVYERDADALRRPDDRRAAARDLIGLDDAEGRSVFQDGTRKKLERLLKDRAINASNPSCPELALLRAALVLEGGLRRIQLVRPEPPSEDANPSRASAARALSVACARLRLSGLMRILEEAFDIEVDGLLLEPASLPWPEAFEDAELDRGRNLETVVLRLYGGERDSILIEWRPDLDDLAILRVALMFAEEPALTADASTPSLAGFCSGAAPSMRGAPPELLDVARVLQRTAASVLEHGMDPERLAAWPERWKEAVDDEQMAGRERFLGDLALAGTLQSGASVALTAFAPLKCEWFRQQLDALWSLLWLALHGGEAHDNEPLEDTAAGVARATAAHYPAHLRIPIRDRPLVPSAEARIWSVFGGQQTDAGQHGGAGLRAVIERLLLLQPEAASHLQCLAWGPGAADLLVDQAIDLVGRRVGRADIGKIEIFCIEDGPGTRPLAETLARADAALAGAGGEQLELRYLPSLDEARMRLQAHSPDVPIVHLAVICGLTAEGQRLQIESPELDPPPHTNEALFAPRVWVRANSARNMLLAPPAVTDAGGAWLRLMTALYDTWPGADGKLRLPELRTTSADLSEELRLVHDLALWVATLDPYATRDSLHQALGEDVAILHQERRLGGDSPLSLVLSQKSGGPADRAIGRSLKSAGIVEDRDVALSIGTELRKVASQGYGILALEAATTGAGINELVGHVVAFSMLATTATPWPLPPGCRVLLISLDDYKQWFPVKRADLLVLALDTEERGVHGAAIEVKARRSDAQPAASDAIDQLRQTLIATRWAGYPDIETIHTRLWVNRIVEAACAVARESNFRLTAAELDALEQFRSGVGTLEWAGIGLIFGPTVEELHRDRPQQLAGDLVPINIQTVRLTEERLRAAAGTSLADLRTVDAEREPLGGGRLRRRPERAADPTAAVPLPLDGSSIEPFGPPSAPEEPPMEPERPPAERTIQEPQESASEDESGTVISDVPFQPPVLGWDPATGAELLWNAAGEGGLPNGHVEIWGSSGAGKTEFTKSLLAQLAAHSGAHFGIADFKNDYGGAFPDQAGAKFMDLWATGAPYNPLALPEGGTRQVRSAIIELRDTVDVATQSFARMGVRQKAKLADALAEAYRLGEAERRWPTLMTLDALLDDDLRGIIGDLTGNPIFGEGAPLGDATNENVIFGLSRIPGNGLTTVLAAGFILSALQLKIQGLPPVANTIRYVAVVDEAHRVSAFKAIDTMIREGRSKGLAVLLATQQPGDLPDVVATNAQTKICFRLPDAAVATSAARRLDPTDSELPEQIRTLDVGEALVSLGGAAPRLLRMAQHWRDREKLGARC
jgi:hypothetical protein